MTVTNPGAWSTPVAQLTKYTGSQATEYANRFRLYGRYQQWLTPGAPFKLGIAFDSWGAWPEFKTAAATTTVRIWPNPSLEEETARWSTIPAFPLTIPWNPAWLTQLPSGSDRGCLVTYPDGTGYEILALHRPILFEEFALGVATEGAYQAGDLMCDQITWRKLDNIREYNGRGMGEECKITGLLTGTDLLGTDIKHALAVVGFNLETGPSANYADPATRVEHPGSTNTFTGYHPNAPDSRLIPQGTRLYLNMTSTAMNAWATKKWPSSGDATLKKTGLKLARCLKYYGIIIGAESGHGDPLIEATGRYGTDSATFMKSGLSSAAVCATVLDGLDWTKLRVVAPAR